MTCRICEKSILTDCTEVTKVHFRYDCRKNYRYKKVYTHMVPEVPHAGSESETLEPEQKKSYHYRRDQLVAQSDAKKIVVHTCGHVFHKRCLRNYNLASWKRDPDCAVCHQRLTGRGFIIDAHVHNGLTVHAERRLDWASEANANLRRELYRYEKKLRAMEVSFKRANGKLEKLELQIVEKQHQQQQRDLEYKKAIDKELKDVKESILIEEEIHQGLRKQNRILLEYYLLQVRKEDFPKDAITKLIPRGLIPCFDVILTSEPMLDKLADVMFSRLKSSSKDNSKKHSWKESRIGLPAHYRLYFSGNEGMGDGGDDGGDS